MDTAAAGFLPPGPLQARLHPPQLLEGSVCAAVTKLYRADLPSSLQAIEIMQLDNTLYQELELTICQLYPLPTTTGSFVQRCALKMQLI